MVFATPSWKQDDNRTLELSGSGGEIIRFVLDAAPRDPHFEVLSRRDGRNMVWVAPPDHVWHYGLWFSWKTINGVNFWETNPESGLQQGRNEVLDPVILSDPDADSAIVRYRELSFPDPDAAAVLEDIVEIRITRPKADYGPVVEWSVKTTALVDGVVLDRTPPPGEPDGKSWGGYAGFSWRGAKDFTDVHYLGSQGLRDKAIHRQPGSWINITGTLAGSPEGLLIVDHPSNPRHPPSWYIFLNRKLPFWYVNPALLQTAPIRLAKGESIHHRYLTILHSGDWSAERCQKEAEEWLTSDGPDYCR